VTGRVLSLATRCLGINLLGLDGEAATDGSHPNDLGMVRYADAYEPVLRAILKQY
jgi:lysophospholipase L1-like esterase